MANERLRKLGLLILKPVVRYLLKKSFQFQEFNQLAKQAYVECGLEILKSEGSKANASRIAVMTGVYREEVKKLLDQNQKSPAQSFESKSLQSRVLAAWEQMPEFCNAEGAPRNLSCVGANSDFANLVSKVSKNINPATVLFELERNEAVYREGPQIRFKRAFFRMSDEDLRGYELLAEDLETLITAVDDNIRLSLIPANLHLRTEYDNIYQEDVTEIKEWLVNQGKAFHRRVREYLTQFDKDLTPKPGQKGEAGAKVVVGNFGLAIVPRASSSKT